MNRTCQFSLIVSTLLGSWLGMQAVHELGHVAGAWLTGGRVERVVLHPLTISRTDLSLNPRPLVVVWAGPIIGVTLPVLLWGIVCRFPVAFVVRFFAGFCLLANGLYVGVGSFDGVGDCGEMLRHGSECWHLWLFGAGTAPIGIWCWHGQGRHFGLGPASGRASRGVTIGVAAICIAMLLFGFVFGGE